MKKFRFSNSQEAYNKINEFFLNRKEEIEVRGGGRYGGQMVMYDVVVEIQKAWVSPRFDFGNMFGYRQQKWSGLLRNYLDPMDLKDLQHRIKIRLLKKTKNYTESMVFHNKHGHGKGCLLSLTCVQRQESDTPRIHVHIRSSEVTKRLLMDLLLIQRIGESMYEGDFGIKLWVINMYQNAEAFTMLDNWLNIVDMAEMKGGKFDSWQENVLKTLKKFQTCNIDEIKMKVHKRCVRQLQRPNGIPLSGNRPMLAKDLKI